jgi:hypothetical protein
MVGSVVKQKKQSSPPFALPLIEALRTYFYSHKIEIPNFLTA